jgi:hypothetical protein
MMTAGHRPLAVVCVDRKMGKLLNVSVNVLVVVVVVVVVVVAAEQ